MARSKYPHKDSYDPTPYNALGATQATGTDIRHEVAALIFHTRTRPGFMATRFNNAGIKSPTGGTWDWIQVRDEKEWFVREEVKKGNYLRPLPRWGAMRVGPSGSWEWEWR